MSKQAARLRFREPALQRRPQNRDHLRPMGPLEDYQNVTKHEEALKHMKLAAATATGFTSVICTNIWMHFNKG